MLRLLLRLFWCSTPSIPFPLPPLPRFRFNNPFAILVSPRRIRDIIVPPSFPTPPISDFFRRAIVRSERLLRPSIIFREMDRVRLCATNISPFEPVIRSIGGRNKNIAQIVFPLYPPSSSIYLFVYFYSFSSYFNGGNEKFFGEGRCSIVKSCVWLLAERHISILFVSNLIFR